MKSLTKSSCVFTGRVVERTSRGGLRVEGDREIEETEGAGEEWRLQSPPVCPFNIFQSNSNEDILRGHRTWSARFELAGTWLPTRRLAVW